MTAVVAQHSQVDREEEAKTRRPRTTTLLARPSKKKTDAKAHYAKMKRRYPSVLKYLAEH